MNDDGLRLLKRATKQLQRWSEKYGAWQPDWLPPAGDIRLAEDIDEFERTSTNCTWRYDSDTDSYDTDCGDKHIMIEGTPAINGMCYCCYCGLRMGDGDA